MHPTKAALLAAGDIRGLLALNHTLYGDAQAMARGYASFGDVMQRTADGRPFNELYAEFLALAQIANEQQQRFVDVFTFPTSTPVVSVLQTLGGDFTFAEASEYGIPTAQRIDHASLNMGATFKWYDARWGATWQYLADATSAELEAAVNAIVAADADLVYNEVMRSVFRPANRTYTDPRTSNTYTVHAFANADGWVPPTYAAQTFDASHTHYRVSGAATVTSGDLDEIVADFKSHGYSQENGSRIVIFVNPIEGDVVNGFRVATGAKADFIASTTAPGFYSPTPLIGDQPAGTFAGFPVKGSYDEALIIESTRIPANYLVALASGGSLAPSNPIMLREHERLKGLVLVKGKDKDYPLVDSIWARGMGTGVRHRLAGMVMQVKASGSYAAPAAYAA